jgi:hypothetical protein
MPMLLEQLDQKTLAVELIIGGEIRILRGAARFVNDPDLGNCLRIAIDDMDTELLLRASEWTGSIAVDDRHGCDYRIRLDQVCMLQ